MPPHEIFGSKCPMRNRVKPYFSNKGASSTNKIQLIEEGKLISDDKKVANIFNSYFNEITDSLNLKDWKASTSEPAKDEILRIIDKYASHPSIYKITSNLLNQSTFEFTYVTGYEVNIIIKDLKNSTKSSGDIPVKILKESEYSHLILSDCINNAIDSCEFPDSLKTANITPVYKKDEKSDKANYRPISILPLLSKVFERVIYNQLSNFLDNHFNKLLCGFRKNHSTQHALFRLLHLWQTHLDKNGFVGTILMDLSKAYDCLPHELIIAKLESYGLAKNSLKLINSYLKNRYHKTRINSNFSDLLEIKRGIPQGSILGPLLFNLFINDIFLVISNTEFCNFADDNTIYTYGFNLGNIFRKLQNDLQNILLWLENNSLKANPVKFQFMILGNGTGKCFYLNFNGISIKAADSVKLLGIEIDKNINFNHHIMNLSKKANSKLYALRRIRNYITEENSKVIMNSFILSQFRYCSLIWMFCSKKAYTKIKNIHFRSLKLVFDNYEMTYEELLEMCNSVSIHSLHLQSLMIEIFKCVNSLNPEFMWSLFENKNLIYNLRQKSLLRIPSINNKKIGLNSLSFRGSILWNRLPNEYKSKATLQSFKDKIKSWIGIEWQVA